MKLLHHKIITAFIDRIIDLTIDEKQFRIIQNKGKKYNLLTLIEM